MAMNDATTPMDELKEVLSRFNTERGWGRFHTPQQLAMALSAEAGELLELFLWKREDEVPDRARLGEEMADVLICLSNLARRLDLDLMRAAELKIAKNAEKYPIAKAFGRADKWDVLAAGSMETAVGTSSRARDEVGLEVRPEIRTEVRPVISAAGDGPEDEVTERGEGGS